MIVSSLLPNFCSWFAEYNFRPPRWAIIPGFKPWDTKCRSRCMAPRRPTLCDNFYFVCLHDLSNCLYHTRSRTHKTPLTLVKLWDHSMFSLFWILLRARDSLWQSMFHFGLCHLLRCVERLVNSVSVDNPLQLLIDFKSDGAQWATCPLWY